MFEESPAAPESPTLKFDPIDTAVAKFASLKVASAKTSEAQEPNIKRMEETARFARAFLEEHGIKPDQASSVNISVWDEKFDPALNFNLEEGAGLINFSNKVDGGTDHSVSFKPFIKRPDSTQSTVVGVQLAKDRFVLDTNMWLSRTDEGSTAKPDSLKVSCTDLTGGTTGVDIVVSSEGIASIRVGSVITEADWDLHEDIDKKYGETYPEKRMDSNFLYEIGDQGDGLPSKEKVRKFILRYFEDKWNLPAGQLEKKVDIRKTFDNALKKKVDNNAQAGIVMTELAFQEE